MYTVTNRIAYITLNRPEKRNALSPELVANLQDSFDKAIADSSVKIIVLQAEGEVFSAGADLAYLQQLQTNTFDENHEDSRILMHLFSTIYTCPKVVIAAVQGHAIAGGCGLATVCDFVYAVPSASFGYTEVKIGFIPAIVSVFLLRKIGEGKAKELLLTGKLIDAQKALDFGLINEICTPEVLMEQVNALAKMLCESTSAHSLGLTKQMIANIPSMPTDEALSYAALQNAHTRAHDDCKKGISAFLNKEKLVW